MRVLRLSCCSGALLMALAGCVSRPPACEWTEPGPLPASLMQEGQNLQPLLDELIQPLSLDSPRSGRK